MKLSSFRKLFFTKSEFIFILSIIFFLIAGSLNNSFKKIPLKLDKQQTALNLNKNLLVLLSAGNKRLITDLLWVQTLIESDIVHYKEKDLNSWMYLRFMTIAHLDSLFYENYLFGGQYLSIVKDDLDGAIDLLKRGVRFYPADYKLKYFLGFTYFYELGDYENGAKWLESISDHPKAPPFVKVIVSKLKFEMNQDFDLALTFLKDLMESTKDNLLKQKLQKDYYALKAEKDLTCLNQKTDRCDNLDSNGQPYINKNGVYYSQTPFTPYRLKRKKK